MDSTLKSIHKTTNTNYLSKAEKILVIFLTSHFCFESKHVYMQERGKVRKEREAEGGGES